jgi:hypothetical protein
LLHAWFRDLRNDIGSYLVPGLDIIRIIGVLFEPFIE